MNFPWWWSSTTIKKFFHKEQIKKIYTVTAEWVTIMFHTSLLILCGSYCSPTIYFSTFWEKQLFYSTHNPLLNPRKWIIVNEWSSFQRTSVLQYFQLHNFSMHSYTHNRLSALILEHNHFLHHMVCNQVY